MKFLFFSKDGMSLPLAMRVANEGNEVYFYVHDPKSKEIGEGLIEKVNDYKKVLSPETIVVFDMVGFGRIADALRKSGYSVIGGGLVNDRLELDRPYGSLIMQTAGIKIPPTYVFNSFDEAISFVKKNPRPFVFKPSGNMRDFLTYVSSNYKDILNFLYYAKKTSLGKTKIEFELQEKIEGVECSCEGFFNGLEWVDGWCNITLEDKRLMDNNAGENTGCSQDLVKVLPNQRETLIFKKTLEKLTPFLRSVGYKGVLDINCIYFNGTPFGLEWSSRWGYDAIYTMLELVKTDFGKILADAAKGILTKVETDKNLFSGSVRCSVLRHPQMPPRLVQNIQNFRHIHPLDVKIDEQGNLVCIGNDVAIITSTGYTIPDTAERVYYLLNKVKRFGIQDLRFRSDLANVSSRYEKLKSWQLI